MANFHTDEWIMTKVKEHYEEALTLYPPEQIIGIFCQGSQNYQLDYEDSDIDTKVLLVPELDDIIFNRKAISTTHIRENNEHIDLKDIRVYFQTFRKQNINFLEILFTKYCIINPKYVDLWNLLVEHREEIAHYNFYRALSSIKGMCSEKYHALEHMYPSRAEIVQKFGYDPKQLHHLVRFYEFAIRYIYGETYEARLNPKNPEYLIKVKKGDQYDLAEARLVAKSVYDQLCFIIDRQKGYCDKEDNDEKVDQLLDHVQKEIVIRYLKEAL